MTKQHINILQAFEKRNNKIKHHLVALKKECLDKTPIEEDIDQNGMASSQKISKTNPKQR